MKQTKKKKLKLTNTEKRLLEYPPTPETWICPRDEMANSGKSARCFWCAEEKPKRPKKLWPSYEAACKKVGIEPGMKWKTLENGQPMMREKGKSWQIAPPI